MFCKLTRAFIDDDALATERNEKMNRVCLIGRLVRDPEMRYASTGVAVTRFVVAVNRKLSKEKKIELEAQGKPTADFISCQAFGGVAETIANCFAKGNLIGLEGSIQTGSYLNKNNQKVYTTDVIVNSVDFIQSNNTTNNNIPADAGIIDNGFFPVDNEDIPF